MKNMKFTYKNILFYVSFIFLMTGFNSCWDDFDEKVYLSADVLGFGFPEQANCPEIENYTFNVDNINGLIYNLDSLPFGSSVSRLYPKIKVSSTFEGLYFRDSIWSDSSKFSVLEEGDSINFDSTVYLRNISSDGMYERTYSINVNVHQVEPDSMVYINVSDSYPSFESSRVMVLGKDNYGYFKKLRSYGSVGGIFSSYISEDAGKTWNKESLSGLPAEMNVKSIVKFNGEYYGCSKDDKLYSSSDGLSWHNTVSDAIVTLFGSIKRKSLTEKYPYYLIGLIKAADGTIHYAKSNDGLSWMTGAVVDDKFPVYGYALATDSTVTGVQSYYIATGYNSNRDYSYGLWCTDDGLYWFLVNDNNLYDINAVPRSGASLFFYDGALYCYGGENQDGNYMTSLYTSKGHGTYWKEAKERYSTDILEAGLKDAEILVNHVADDVNDKDREFIMIFGGKSVSGIRNNVIKQYLNQMTFARR